MIITRFTFVAALLAVAPVVASSPAEAQSMREGDSADSGLVLDFSLPDGVDIFADIAVGAYLARDEVGDKIDRTSVKSDGRVGFAIERTIFNGMQVLGNATWDLDLDPESYAAGVGGGFGQIRFGSEDNIAEQMHVSIPVFVPHKAVSLDSADIYPSSNLSAQRSTYIEAETLVISLGEDHLLEGNARDDGSNLDPNTLTYIAPEFLGLTVGFSYIPDVDDAGQANQAGPLQDIAGNSVVNSATILGLRYEGYPLGADGIGVLASFGYMNGDSNIPGLDAGAVSGGLQVKAGNVTLGMSYFDADDLANLDSDENEVWIAGLSYKSGNVTVGAAYRKSRTEYDFNGTRRGVIYDNVQYRGHNEALQLGLIYDTGQRYSYGLDLRHIRDRNNLNVDTAGQTTTVTSAAGRRVWRKSYSAAFVLSISY